MIPAYNIQMDDRRKQNIEIGELIKQRGRLMVSMSHKICNLITLPDTMDNRDLLQTLQIFSSIHNQRVNLPRNFPAMTKRVDHHQIVTCNYKRLMLRNSVALIPSRKPHAHVSTLRIE